MNPHMEDLFTLNVKAARQNIPEGYEELKSGDIIRRSHLFYENAQWHKHNDCVGEKYEPSYGINGYYVTIRPINYGK